MEGQNGYSVPVRKMVSYIHQHYMDGISLGDAADNAGMNSSYLSTLFKNEVGTGFVEYLNEVRLERAKELMDSSQLRLKEIIDEVGFCSYPYFSACLRKIWDDAEGISEGPGAVRPPAEKRRTGWQHLIWFFWERGPRTGP